MEVGAEGLKAGSSFLKLCFKEGFKKRGEIWSFMFYIVDDDDDGDIDDDNDDAAERAKPAQFSQALFLHLLQNLQ